MFKYISGSEVRKRIIFLACLLLSSWPGNVDPVGAGHVENPNGIIIDVGGDEPEGSMGFGWSRKESDHVRTFRWIEGLEADVWFDLEESTDLRLRIKAAPLYIGWKRQNIGIYVNQRFLKEWVCPDSHEFAEYSVDIPGYYLRDGSNRMILRLGYSHRIGRERRELSLAVEKIVMERR